MVLKFNRAKIRLRREFKAKIRDRLQAISNKRHLNFKSLRLSNNISQRLSSHLKIKEDTRTHTRYLILRSKKRLRRRRKLQHVKSSRRRYTLSSLCFLSSQFIRIDL